MGEICFYTLALVFPWKRKEKSADNETVELDLLLVSGAIIGDGDRKRATFLVLGLAL